MTTVKFGETYKRLSQQHLSVCWHQNNTTSSQLFPVVLAARYKRTKMLKSAETTVFHSARLFHITCISSIYRQLKYFIFMWELYLPSSIPAVCSRFVRNWFGVYTWCYTARSVVERILEAALCGDYCFSVAVISCKEMCIRDRMRIWLAS